MTRMEAIKAAVRPFGMAANFNIEDVMLAATRAVPDASPVEVSEAFEALAEEADADLAVLHSEIDRRGNEP